MGLILEAQVSFNFRFYAFLKELVSDFGDFQTLCVIRDSHRESTTCKLVCEMNRGIHSKSGSSFMGLAVNAGIMRNVLPFLFFFWGGRKVKMKMEYRYLKHKFQNK